MTVSQSTAVNPPSYSSDVLDALVPELNAAQVFLPMKPDWSHGDQSLEDAATLIALARLKKDGRMLEIGTSAGEGAAALLYGARDGTATLCGIDLAKQVYYDKSRAVGDVVRETLPDIQSRYTIFSGVTAEHVLTMDTTFDLIHIDAAHSHPWATFDLLCALTRANEGAIFAFHDANYTAALSQAAYYLARTLGNQGRFIGNHFVFVYQGITPDLVDAILRSLQLNWQAALPPEKLVALHAALAERLSATDAMRIMALLLEKNAEFHANSWIQESVNNGLWQRELERRRLLAAVQEQGTKS